MAKTPIKTLNGHALVDETARAMAQEALDKAGEGVGGTSEEWTFTLEDGSTVTKKVVIAE